MNKKILFIILCGIVGIILFVFLAATAIIGLTLCNSNNNEIKDKETSVPKIENNQKKIEENKEEVKEFYVIGEEIKIEDNKLLVNSLERSSGKNYSKPQEGNEFVIVNVTISNEGTEEINYNPYNFEMQNSQGQIKDKAITLTDKDTALHEGKLAPNGTITGTIAFEQPVGDTNLILRYKPNIFSDKEVKIQLN